VCVWGGGGSDRQAGCVEVWVGERRGKGVAQTIGLVEQLVALLFERVCQGAVYRAHWSHVINFRVNTSVIPVVRETDVGW
jgi:hypothetical protein